MPNVDQEIGQTPNSMPDFLLRISSHHYLKTTSFLEEHQIPFQLVMLENPYKYWGDLSEDKRFVLEMLAEGKGYRTIAEQMGISINTVRFKIKQIYKTLGVKNKVEATRICLTHKNRSH